MKKLVLIAILMSVLPCLAATPYNVDEATHQKYKVELESKGYLYGCSTPNFSPVKIRKSCFLAVANGENHIIDLYIKAGLDLNSCINNMSFQTIDRNHPKTLNLLLENGVDVNKDFIGMSLIDYAISCNKRCPDCPSVILKYNPEITDKTLKLVKKSKNPEIKALFE